MAIVKRSKRGPALVRGQSRRDKDNLLKPVPSLSDAGDREVPAVDWVEGAPKECELHHGFRCLSGG